MEGGIWNWGVGIRIDEDILYLITETILKHFSSE
jgi:hypothetical protein